MTVGVTVGGIVGNTVGDTVGTAIGCWAVGVGRIIMVSTLGRRVGSPDSGTLVGLG